MFSTIPTLSWSTRISIMYNRLVLVMCKSTCNVITDIKHQETAKDWLVRTCIHLFKRFYKELKESLKCSQQAHNIEITLLEHCVNPGVLAGLPDLPHMACYSWSCVWQSGWWHRNNTCSDHWSPQWLAPSLPLWVTLEYIWRFITKVHHDWLGVWH